MAKTYFLGVLLATASYTASVAATGSTRQCSFIGHQKQTCDSSRKVINYFDSPAILDDDNSIIVDVRHQKPRNARLSMFNLNTTPWKITIPNDTQDGEEVLMVRLLENGLKSQNELRDLSKREGKDAVAFEYRDWRWTTEDRRVQVVVEGEMPWCEVEAWDVSDEEWQCESGSSEPINPRGRWMDCAFPC